MKILLLGATGRTGKEILYQALQAGISVNVLVREADKVSIADKALRIVESKTLDETALRKAMQGCDAVISALNISRNSDFPWSSLRTSKTLLSDTVRNVIEIARELTVKRVIVLSAWGVHETKKDIPFWFRWLIDFSNIGAGYRDHERQETLLKASNLDWTSIRPVVLTNFKKSKSILTTIANNPKPNLVISRSDVARYLLEVYQNKSYIKQAVTVSEK